MGPADLPQQVFDGRGVKVEVECGQPHIKFAQHSGGGHRIFDGANSKTGAESVRQQPYRVRVAAQDQKRRMDRLPLGRRERQRVVLYRGAQPGHQLSQHPTLLRVGRRRAEQVLDARRHLGSLRQSEHPETARKLMSDALAGAQR